MKNIFLICLISCFMLTALEAQVYQIDPGHSTVLMQVQRFGVVNVVGRFGDIEGTINYNSDELASTEMNVRIGVKSYTANNPGGEESAKAATFLDAANHPDILFVLDSVEANDDSTLTVSGDLTIKGETRKVSFDASFIGPKLDLPTRKQSIAFSGELIINRLDFGVGPTRNLPDGTEIISNRVEISFEILAIMAE